MARSRSAEVIPGSRSIDRRKFARAARGISTPFGRPVVPEVNRMYASEPSATGSRTSSRGLVGTRQDVQAQWPRRRRHCLQQRRIGERDQDLRVRVFQHDPNALDRMGRIDRDVARARLQGGQEGCELARSSRQGNGHPGLTPNAVLPELNRQEVGNAVELAEGKRSLVCFDRRVFRSAAHLDGKALQEIFRGVRRAGPAQACKRRLLTPIGTGHKGFLVINNRLDRVKIVSLFLFGLLHDFRPPLAGPPGSARRARRGGCLALSFGPGRGRMERMRPAAGSRRARASEKIRLRTRSPAVDRRARAPAEGARPLRPPIAGGAELRGRPPEASPSCAITLHCRSTSPIRVR